MKREHFLATTVVLFAVLALTAAEKTVNEAWNEEYRELAGQISRMNTARPEWRNRLKAEALDPQALVLPSERNPLEMLIDHCCSLETVSLTAFATDSIGRLPLGIVPVEEDGSVYCEAPVGKALYFQLLDEQGMAVHSMRSATYVHSGEHLSCAEGRHRLVAAHRCRSAKSHRGGEQLSTAEPCLRQQRYKTCIPKTASKPMKLKMFLDGKKVSDVSMVYLPSFFATAGYDRKGKTVVLKATNYNKKPMQATLQLEGASSVSATGKQFIIRADSLTDENSLEQPRRIVPQEQILPNCAKQFSVTLPSYSVNLLRIPASAQ